jgi:pimeloyl-ACP methyl ester carboxylesterase
MGCSIDGEFERNLEQELHSAGFSTLFFNSYDEGAQSRSLGDMSLRDHVDDLDDVIKWAKSEYAPGEVIVAGHSFGGLTALLRGSSGIDALVLCDPSERALAAEIVSHGTLNGDRYDCHWEEGDERLTVHRSLVEELQVADTDTAAARLRVPLVVMSAGQGELTESGKRYASLARGRQIIIENAGHMFQRPQDARMIARATTDLAKGLGGVSM